MSIFSGPGAAAAFSSANGGKIYAFNNIAAVPIPVATKNTGRLKILFHNPGPTDVFIAPANVLVSGSDTPLVPSGAALGGCFRVYGNGGSLEISGECQGVWQAFALAGTTNPLTVMETNV